MSEFVDYLPEVFAQFGPVEVRAMFGGHGVFHNNLMIGLVAKDVLYLKADDESAPLFEAEGLEPFIYNKAGKLAQMSYYEAPEVIFDDPEAASLWASRAYEAAVRGNKPERIH
ncbi:MAG: hypothetical protein RLZZ385_343 [Pseudomonadota bacterium]|jgi:DNA transformation protein